MTNVQKIVDLTDIASRIVEKYYEIYPDTNSDIFTVSSIMMDAMEELKKYENVTENDFRTIISNLRKTNTDNSKNNGGDVFFKLLKDLTIFPEQKKTCKCEKNGNSNNVAKPDQNTEKQISKNPACKCNDRKTNIKDTETEKTIQILMPGVKKQNISITVENNKVVVKLKDIVFEYPFVNPNLRYEFDVDENFDMEHAKSSLEDGILTITIPKKEKPVIIIDVL